MLTKRQQQVLKVIVEHGAMAVVTPEWLWIPLLGNLQSLIGVAKGGPKNPHPGFISYSTIYALAHHGLVAFVDTTTVSPTPKGEALAALLDETTMVTRRGNGVVIS